MRAVVSSMYAGSSTYPVRYLAVGARSRRSMATTAFPGRGTLERADIELLGSLRSKTASNVAYPLDNGQKKGMLVRLGPIIRELLPHCGKDGMLARLYREQYREVPQSGDGDAKGPEGPVETAVPEPREAKEIPADSLQSVHDPEAAFRRKGHGTGEQKVSGYHANVTETFGGDLLGLPWFRHRRFHGPFRALCVPVPALRDFPVLLPVEARQHGLTTKKRTIS